MKIKMTSLEIDNIIKMVKNIKNNKANWMIIDPKYYKLLKYKIEQDGEGKWFEYELLNMGNK